MTRMMTSFKSSIVNLKKLQNVSTEFDKITTIQSNNRTKCFNLRCIDMRNNFFSFIRTRKIKTEMLNHNILSTFSWNEKTWAFYIKTSLACDIRIYFVVCINRISIVSILLINSHHIFCLWLQSAVIWRKSIVSMTAFNKVLLSKKMDSMYHALRAMDGLKEANL